MFTFGKLPFAVIPAFPSFRLVRNLIAIGFPTRFTFGNDKYVHFVHSHLLAYPHIKKVYHSGIVLLSSKRNGVAQNNYLPLDCRGQEKRGVQTDQVNIAVLKPSAYFTLLIHPDISDIFSMALCFFCFFSLNTERTREQTLMPWTFMRTFNPAAITVKAAISSPFYSK